jgi:L-malate glycosyltransferase
MRIAHVVDSMEVGGAETLVLQMCRMQREQGHDPCVYAIAALGELGKQMQKEGFTVESAIGRHLLDSARNFSRIFKQCRPDIVHLHNPTPTIYASVAAKAAGVPRIVSTRHSLVDPPYNVAAELKYGIAARFCDWIIGICDATTNNMRNLHSVPARKIVRVYNGAVPLQRVDKCHWPPKSGFTLVYVGRLEPVKNHGLLLHAFRDALHSLPDLKLWIVGEGTERGRLEHLTNVLGVGECVTFWGQQLDVAPFFSAADVFVMSSSSEGLPMSLLQAFSMGLPAVVTDVGGMVEAVRITRGGVTVSARDSAEMTAAILRMACSDYERMQLSRNATEGFREFFSLSTMVSAYMALYTQG